MSKLGTQEDRGEDIPGTGAARAKAVTGNPYGSQKPLRGWSGETWDRAKGCCQA